MKTFFETYSSKLILFTFIALLTSSCLSDSVTEPEPPEENGPDYPSPTESEAPDGILETVTWNLERYGDDLYGSEAGIQRTKNILRIADSLKADLYGLQEITGQAGLDTLSKYMPGYRGFVADYITYNQKLGFLYNTNTIDSLSSGAITTGQDDYDWAGRLPLYFSFNYNYNGTSTPIYAIVIHAKANTGNTQELEEAYERRVRAAESLYTYLQSEKPDTRIILLGDYNDDVDVSIYDDSSPSPYDDFVMAENSFRAVTESISDANQSSYIAGDYSDLIDHIIISDELFNNYTASSEEIYFEAENFIEDYVNTTSDHLPVWAKIDFTGAN
ncbi:hypothetical protein G3570_05160 [Balneolaceae bacterium YR4-1]|uniref:Endonuclease/exonuclease/phosphatase domain-containing protein n=1 Tax=Halalkalibaculum roseum TaxID=2709311 RepID=A0A6M1SZN2_9BACT|nr:endonuclease/exonuclease/phosphatase family protein [Halalkalibaculum roseum]NGP76007.1 hypothetical protein [Halalkalibaculum roseum]